MIIQCKLYDLEDIKKLRKYNEQLYQDMISRFGDKKQILKFEEADDGSWSEVKKDSVQ